MPGPATAAPRPHDGRARLLLVAVVALFAALATALALTRPPHTDEGHFASAGAAFAEHGRLVMPMWTEWIASLDERLYATMPLYFVALGGWFAAFGVSFESMRLLSVAWGVALVLAWYVSGREIGGGRAAGVLTAVFVGLNYDVVNAASARYDVMAAGLGALALAAYLALRERRLVPAIVVSQALVCAACLTHPLGVIGGAGVLIFALSLDWRRLRPRHLLAAAAPYVVGLSLWGLYVAQDPATFREQFAENAGGRVAATSPLGALAEEVRVRYVAVLGGWQAGAPAVGRVRVLTLVAYLVGLVGCLLAPAVRRSPAGRALLLYALAGFLLLAFLDSNRWYIYTIHVVPVYAACAALFADRLRRRGGAARALAIAAAVGFALFAAASVAYRARLDVHGRAFEPTVAFLRERLRPGDLVMAGGEFGVGLGFERHVLDDMELGRRNGRTPDYVVVGRDYATVHAGWRRRSPRHAAHVDSVLRDYVVVYRSPQVSDHQYRVYAPRTPGGQSMPSTSPSRSTSPK